MNIGRATAVLVRLASIAIAGTGNTGCQATGTHSLSTTASPGTAIVTFPNSFDGQWSTAILSQPYATEAGVDGRTMAVSLMHGSTFAANNLTLDFNGNLGIRGVYRSISTRKSKWLIAPFRGDALALISSVPISTYHYVGEDAREPLHIGFIAEDAPEEFSGRGHDSFNLNNSVGVNMAATKELNVRVERLTREVARLERLVAASRSPR